MEYKKGVINVKVGSILKACRERSGISQAELADKLFINQSDVSKIETDVKEPPVSLFQSWINQTQAQEVMVAYILGIDGITILQNLLESGFTIVNTILGGIF